MVGTEFHSVLAYRAQIPRFAKSGITPWQTALKGMNIFLLAIRGQNTAVCHDPRYTFERGLPQQSEIQYPSFYIDSPPVRGAQSFDARIYKCKTYTRRIV
jgi:hypothetical protein